MSRIEAIISQLRVPDLPYPVSRRSDVPDTSWAPFLAAAWEEQTNDTVISRLKAAEDTQWTVRQVNAGYLADRIMDVFLRKSGLHSSLISRVARLRFWLALDLHERGGEAVAENSPIRRWLESLDWLKGWSETGGRSDRQVLKQLEALRSAINAAFGGDDQQALETFVLNWLAEMNVQNKRVAILEDRLLKTERGAAGQRAAENAAQSAIGRAVKRRRLPEPVIDFILQDWRAVLRESVVRSGVGSEHWRHGNRLLEWLVWVADPALSNNARDKLYQVGEHLVDKMEVLLSSLYPEGYGKVDLAPVEQLLMVRLRGGETELTAAPALDYDSRWLEPLSADERREGADWEGQWYLVQEGGRETRQYLFTILECSGEVLWTNGFGVRLGTQLFSDTRDALANGRLRHLPPLFSFGEVLESTLTGLSRVLTTQQQKREEAIARARREAETLRQQQEETRIAEEKWREEEARQEEEARSRAAKDAEERARQEAEAARKQQEKTLLGLVDQVHLGGWVELETGTEDAQRLKLALRISATGKLVFVDRLGLNRRELNRHDLKGMLIEGRARILNNGAEFEETLSRVVGRLRGGV